MPYIPEESRERLTEQSPMDAGELTYWITCGILDYIEARGKRYSTFAEILGALEATKHELYRREIAPYEDQKIEENGDVYA